MFEAENDDLRLRYGAGNEDAFNELVARNWGPVCRALRFKLGISPEDAEEAVSEGCKEAWRNAARYDPKVPFRIWLFTLAQKKAIDRLRNGRAQKRGGTLRQVPLDESFQDHRDCSDPHGLCLVEEVCDAFRKYLDQEDLLLFRDLVQYGSDRIWLLERINSVRAHRGELPLSADQFKHWIAKIRRIAKATPESRELRCGWKKGDGNDFYKMV